MAYDGGAKDHAEGEAPNCGLGTILVLKTSFRDSRYRVKKRYLVPLSYEYRLNSALRFHTVENNNNGGCFVVLKNAPLNIEPGSFAGLRARAGVHTTPQWHQMGWRSNIYVLNYPGRCLCTDVKNLGMRFREASLGKITPRDKPSLLENLSARGTSGRSNRAFGLG